jgi:hypothetical protein
MVHIVPSNHIANHIIILYDDNSGGSYNVS